MKEEGVKEEEGEEGQEEGEEGYERGRLRAFTTW